MRRIVRGAVLALSLLAVAPAGCGGDRTAAVRQAGQADAAAPELAAGVLTELDMPRGFLPAENQEVFRGIRPADPDCGRLLALADLRGLGGAPQAHASFYRTSPVSSLVEHVVRLPKGEAARRVAEAHQAGALCPSIRAAAGERRMHLVRHRLGRPFGVRDAYAVRFASRPHEKQVRFDVFVASIGDCLLVVGHPAMADMPGEPRATERVAAGAVRKLRAAQVREWLGAPQPATPPPETVPRQRVSTS